MKTETAGDEPGHGQTEVRCNPVNPDARRPAENGSASDFVISEWRPHIKNTLRGFFTVTLPSKMVLHGCSLHEKNDSRWIGLPAQKFAKEDGTASYTPMVDFATKEARDRFNAAAVRAIDQMLGGGQ